MVAHAWANQSRSSGKGSSFYFDGPTIYSYGPHFPIARHIERRGKKAILFTTDSYSVTTSKHISYARSAIPDYALVIHTARVLDEPNSAALRKEYSDRLAGALSSLAAARTHKDMHAQRAGRIAREANDAAEFFGWTWRLTVPHFTDEWLAEQRAKQSAARAKRAKETKAANEEKARNRALEIDEWRAGNRHTLSWYDRILLRVKGDMIQTSRGAEIPVSHAARLWRVIERARAGQPYQHNGHSEHAGEFKVDSVDVNGTLRAGCHTIEYAELRNLAVTLGLVQS